MTTEFKPQDNMAAIHGERDTITVSEGESTDLFVAKDESTGVASQGETKTNALNNLVEALELYYEEDPEDIELEEPTAPWF